MTEIIRIVGRVEERNPTKYLGTRPIQARPSTPWREAEPEAEEVWAERSGR